MNSDRDMSRLLEVLRRPKAKLQALAKAAQSNRSEGERQLEAGNFAEAEKSLAMAVAEHGGSVARRVGLRLQLAEAQRKQAKLAEAESNFRGALEIAAADQDAGLQVLALHALGDVLIERGNYAEARKSLEQAIAIDGQRKTPDAFLMARRLRQLGIVLHQLGHGPESTAKLKEASTLYQQTCGENHPDTAHVLAELGAAYRAEGKYPDAEKCFSRALEIHAKSCGRQSGEAMRDLSELARTLAEAGDTKRAISEYERALTMRENVVGGTFQELSEMQLTLAGLYVDTENYGRARELLTHAVGGLKSSGGSRLAIAHEALAHVQESLGQLQHALKELERAAPVWESCGRMEEAAANADHRAAIIARLPKEEEVEF